MIKDLMNSIDDSEHEIIFLPRKIGTFGHDVITRWRIWAVIKTYT